MTVSQSPQQYCDKFAAALAAGMVSCVEDFVQLQGVGVDDAVLEQLLAREISHAVESGHVVHEERLIERFPDRKHVVAEVFAEIGGRYFDQPNQLVPDPRKTNPDMIAEMFFRSTNVLCPSNYVELEQELGGETLPSEVCLRIVKGPHSGRELKFSESASLLVGRGEDARLVLAGDQRCSRLHCRFEISPPCCSVIDLKSTNGTLVNGKRVDRADLHDNDTVQIGSTRIRVHIQKGTTEEPVEEAPMATYNPMMHAPEITGYDIENQIGHGRFGVVYAGIERLSQRPVAIKVLCDTASPSNDEIQQFVHEASVSVRLRHSRIVETIDFGMQDGAPYLVLDRISTIEIRQYLRTLNIRQRCLEAARLTACMLEGLEFAHQHGIIHRDIKLSNLLFYREEAEVNLKISDFGLALKAATSYKSQQAVCGTAAYMAPEMISDSAGASPLSDVYAAGVCLYQLISDRRPHEANKLTKLLFMILNEPGTPIRERVPEVPPSLAAIVEKSTARRLRDRYHSAEEMRKALVAWYQRYSPAS